MKTIVVILGAILVTAYCLMEIKEPTPAPHVSKTVHAGVYPGDLTLRIVNEDTNAWPPLRVYLNGSPLQTYGVTIPALKPGDTLTVPLSDFAKENGDRFNPSAAKVVVIWIGGNGFDFVKLGR